MPTVRLSPRTKTRLDLLAQILDCSPSAAVERLVADAQTVVRPQTKVPDTYISLRTASIQTGLPRTVLQQAIDDGVLPAMRRPGGKYWVLRSDLDSSLARMRRRAQETK